MTLGREIVIGRTVLGRPIEAVHFVPPAYAKPRRPALLVGAIHGDEPASQLMLERLADELVARPPGRDTWIVPCLNGDGMLAGTRDNANGVDLNSNFLERRRDGAAPADQPETRALVELIARTGAWRLVAIHALHRRVTWTGCGEALARDMAERSGYCAEPDTDPHPGSFAAKYGMELGREVVVLESPYLVADEAAWLETASALRWCVDLP